MENKFKTVLVNIHGKPFTTDGKELTLKDASIEALTALTEDNQKLSGKEKFKRYQIAQKVNNEENITVEEFSIIKESIGKVYAIGVVGAAYNIIDG